MKFSQLSSLQPMAQGQEHTPITVQGRKRFWCRFCGKQGLVLKNCRAKKKRSSTNNPSGNRQWLTTDRNKQVKISYTGRQQLGHRRQVL